MKYFTSESVTQGHPDKLCDYIADSVLDEYLEKDMNSKVACEVLASKAEVIITGEITSNAKVDIEAVARNAIKEIGYEDEKVGIDYKTCEIHINISKQSEDIALGVNKSVEEKQGKFISEGAGDQGIIFGFACDETKQLMPMPIFLAHKLSKKLEQVRQNNILSYLMPDGKTQVTVQYDEKDIPKRIDTIVISTQHKEGINIENLRKDIIENVIYKSIPNELLDRNTRFLINPTGRFVIGGPLADSGLTGRKIIVDTYGGYSRHGGGAFSGKDPSKVDRSAAYMARHIAKNVVANKYAKKCEIQISYAIGVALPTSIYIDTFGTNTIPEEEILQKIKNKFNLTPTKIIEYLNLKTPIYKQTTNYGHFGKENLAWERIIKF